MATIIGQAANLQNCYWYRISETKQIPTNKSHLSCLFQPTKSANNLQANPVDITILIQRQCSRIKQLITNTNKSLLIEKSNFLKPANFFSKGKNVNEQM